LLSLRGYAPRSSAFQTDAFTRLACETNWWNR